MLGLHHFEMHALFYKLLLAKQYTIYILHEYGWVPGLSLFYIFFAMAQTYFHKYLEGVFPAHVSCQLHLDAPSNSIMTLTLPFFYSFSSFFVLAVERRQKSLS